MTALPLIKDQSVVASPFSDAVKADAKTVGDATTFADIFAAMGGLELRGPDRRGEAPAGRPLVPEAGVEKAVGDDPLMGDVALFAEMRKRTKDNPVVPEVGDPSDGPQAADVTMLGGPEGHLAVLRLIGVLGATDVAIDLDRVVASFAQLLEGDAREADAALPGATSEGVLQDADVPLDAGGELFAAAGVDMALMQVDGRLTIVFAGALGHVLNALPANANAYIIEPMVSAPQQTTEQTAPLMPAEGGSLAEASALPVIFAEMPGISPEGGPQIVWGQVARASLLAPAEGGGLAEASALPVMFAEMPGVSPEGGLQTAQGSVVRAPLLAVAPLEKSSTLVALPGVPGSQEFDNAAAEVVEKLTIRPGALSATTVSDGPEISIGDLVSGAKLVGVPPDALRDGIPVQSTPPEVGPKPGSALASLSGLQVGPADQGADQAAPVIPTANRDLMYLDVTRPNVVSAASLLAGANMKTGRMRSSEQADGQQSEQRLGLVPQPVAGSEILGARTADQARATVTRIVHGDASMNAVNDQKPAPTRDHRATGQATSDMGGPPVAQSGSQTSAGVVSTTPAVPMAQSSGMAAMLDVRRQGWTQTLVQRAAGMVQSGGVLTLKILPQHLGQITLKMSEGRRGLDLRIVTEVASTAAMLRGVENQIASAFEGAGLMLGEFSANTGKGGGTDFGDDSDDSDPASARVTDVDETDAGMISGDTAQHRLLNIIL